MNIIDEIEKLGFEQLYGNNRYGLKYEKSYLDYRITELFYFKNGEVISFEDTTNLSKAQVLDRAQLIAKWSDE